MRKYTVMSTPRIRVNAGILAGVAVIAFVGGTIR
jgi:hypothetical protein